MHDSSARLLEQFCIQYLRGKERMRVADVGCYDESETYKKIVEAEGHAYIGIDCRPGKNVSIVTDEHFEWRGVERGGFEIVISGQTLEHIEQPWVWICRLATITKLGGLIWICAPNSWEFHEVPKDCWRVWPDGMAALLRWGGFEVVNVGKLGPDTWGIGRRVHPI